MSKRGHGDDDDSDDGASRSCKRGHFTIEEQKYQEKRDFVFRDEEPKDTETAVQSNIDLGDGRAMSPQICGELVQRYPEYYVWIGFKPYGFWMLRSSSRRLIYLNQKQGWSLGIIPMDFHATITTQQFDTHSLTK